MKRLLPVALVSMLFLDCGGGTHPQGSTGGSAGGNSSSGGSAAGASGSGGSGVGGANTTGGATGFGGTKSTGGATGTGGAANTGGATGSGGATGGGGVSNKGGTNSTGGTSSGTGGTSAGESNTVPAIMDQGPDNVGYVNGLFVSVTLCEPGTTTCQTIDHVLVDTGSCGLRVLESVLTLSLPAIKNSTGAALGECTQFVSGTAWGPVVKADVTLGGETAPAIPIQAIGEKTYPMPTTGACVSGQAITDLQSLLANGIIGVGIFQQDCGVACEQTRSNPGVYFACTSAKAGGCKSTTVSADSQVRNPIIGFPVDNNGIVIQLPSVPANGLISTTGKLVFGIGTQSNNALGSATAITPVDAYGNIGTTFPVGGTDYTGFIDSGTNTYTFLDAATSGIALCTSPQLSSFYCPSATKDLSATIFGGNNAKALVNFSVANASKLSQTSFVFNDLAGPMPGFPRTSSGVPDFLWGLPFFYGRTVYTAVEAQNTPSGQGPYVAF